MHWESVIGLEVHAQLNTETKLFSKGATAYGAAPNTQASFVDAGLPGTLPVLNKKALHLAIQFGLAIHAPLAKECYFERKNYVYPDLPKAYQISQLQQPLIGRGHLDIVDARAQPKRIIIHHAHLEEDAGKLLHKPAYTAIDLNRAGIPLLEIVTEPCLANSTEVVNFLQTLNQLLRFLNICNGNMQEGAFRCDVNISLRHAGTLQLGTRVELKNLNSYRFITQAIAFEESRQMAQLAAGQVVVQETRLYDEATQTTVAMRSKENQSDYRYFADPDLLPVVVSAKLLAELARTLPELPSATRTRLQKDGIHQEEDLHYLLSSRAIINTYDAVRQYSHAPAKLIVNWLKGHLAALIHAAQQSYESLTLNPQHLAIVFNAIADQQLPTGLAKNIIKGLFGAAPDADVHHMISTQISSDSIPLESIVDTLLAQYPQQVAQYRAGDEKIVSFLIGQVLKNTQGRSDPKIVQQLLVTKMGDQ